MLSTACATQPPRIEKQVERIAPPAEILAACQGFRSDPPPQDVQQERSVAVWISRIYLRALGCEGGIEALRKSLDTTGVDTP